MTTPTTLPADKFNSDLVFVRPAAVPTRVPLDKMAVLPGFNTRVKDEEYSERVNVLAESIELHGFYEHKPFAVTMLPDDETIYIYDGEHRFDAAQIAVLNNVEFPDGLPVAFAPEGSTVKDLTVSLVHGNNGQQLNSVEMAAVVLRLKSYGMEKEEIAKQIGKTTRHLDNLLVLASANNDVKRAVASGQFAAAQAVKMIRKDGTKAAGEKIKQAVKEAADKGKAKATPKTMQEKVSESAPKMKTIPLTIGLATGETMSNTLKALAAAIREHVKTDAEDKIGEDGKITIRLSVIDHDAVANAAAKAKEAEDKAKAKADVAAAKLKEREDKAKAKVAELKAKKDRKIANLKAQVAAKKEQDAMLAKAAGKTNGAGKTDKPATKPAKAPAAAKPTVAAAPAEIVDGAPVPATEDANAGL